MDDHRRTPFAARWERLRHDLDEAGREPVRPLYRFGLAPLLVGTAVAGATLGTLGRLGALPVFAAVVVSVLVGSAVGLGGYLLWRPVADWRLSRIRARQR